MKKEKRNVKIVLLIGVVCIILSYLFYAVFQQHQACGSECVSFFDPLDPRSKVCTTVCVPELGPHPLYGPFLQIGFVLLIIGVFLYLRKSK